MSEKDLKNQNEEAAELKEQPQTEEANELKTEEAATEETVTEVTEESVTEEPAVEEAKTEEPVSEETKSETAAEVTEESVTEEPVVEEAKTEEPVSEETKSETTEKAEEIAEIPSTEVSEVADDEAPSTEPSEVASEDSKEDEKIDSILEDGEKEEKHVEKTIDVADFDWDSYTSDHDDYTPEERAKLENIFDETLSTVAVNEVVEGSVVSMNKREVVINIGYKSEGIVSLNEFRYNPELQPGDPVEVYVETLEDRTGQLLLSHKKARVLRSWDRVNQAHDQSEIIKGFIKCRTKGGMIVDVFGIEAFLPGSQIDVKPIRDYDVYVGKTMEFKVVKINKEFKNVVVSHKALIEAELEIQKQEIISKLEKGQVLEGTVKNITSYGVFIDLGGVDGLIHITDLSWGRVNHPEEVVELDEKINVVILDFDDNKKRIALGKKQLTPHPWDSLDEKLKVGDKVKGKVVVMADYGAFVEIAPGVEGLIHVSEMSWSQHLRSAQEFLKVGDEVEAQVLTMDREDRKMSLGMKQLREDPWSTIDDRYKLNTKHSAKVRNFTGFGIFVEIEEGVDGLIHISDLSWTKKIKHPAEFCSINDQIDVVVLEIDKENRRLSLGHKQLEENPWDVFETLFKEGSVHEGTIVSIFDRGAVITLPYGVEGFATPRHLVKEDNSQAKVDEKLEFKVIEFNKSAKRIILSHSRIFEDEKRAEVAVERKAKSSGASKGMKKVKQSLEATTLGDITDLAALKSKMEMAEKIDSQSLKAKPTPKAKKIEEPVKEEKAVAEEVVEKPAKKEKAVAEEVVEKPVKVKKAVSKKAAPKKVVKEVKEVAEETKKPVDKVKEVEEKAEKKAEVKEEKAEKSEPAKKKATKAPAKKAPAKKPAAKKTKTGEAKDDKKDA